MSYVLEQNYKEHLQRIHPEENSGDLQQHKQASISSILGVKAGQKRKLDRPDTVTDLEPVEKRALDETDAYKCATTSDSHLVSCEEYSTLTDD